MQDIKLIGANITKISGERKQDFSGEISINVNIIIQSIEKIKDPKNTVKISYLFKIDYGELGNIEIGGNLFISAKPETIKKIEKSKNEKKFDSPEYLTLTNLVLRKSSIKAFELEEELNLPIHIKLPSVDIKKKE